MKRIARLNADKFQASDVLAEHGELSQILGRHLPPSTAALFARPKAVEGGVVEWYSGLGGQPVPLSELNAAQATELRRVLDERLQSIYQLADKLSGQGADGQRQADLLRHAARYPDESTVYSLNGQPVLTFWGYGVRPPPVPVAAPTMGAAEAATATAATIVVAKKRRWWPWLLLLLLLLALVAALYCWWKQEPVLPVVEPSPIEAPAPEPEAAVPEPEPEPVIDPWEELAKRIAAVGHDCAALQQLKKDEPLLQEPDPRAEQYRLQIQQTLQQYCKEEMIREAKNLCPNERPPELAPELVMVFDASGSMNYSLLATPREIQLGEQARQMQQAGPLAQMLAAAAGIPPNAWEVATREPRRISAAKQSAISVAKQIPPDVNVGLVLIKDCPSGVVVRKPAAGGRNQLLNQLQTISPDAGTPLANGVAQAGSLVDGVNREAVILVVSDGAESCNGDPCAIAAQLARSKPHLKINVVDIQGTGAGNCLATSTGGKVFTAKNVDELLSTMNQAAQDVLGPTNCAKP